MYDTEKMVAGAAQVRLEFFQNRRQFTDATVKFLNDTNMEADGILGMPLNLAA